MLIKTNTYNKFADQQYSLILNNDITNLKKMLIQDPVVVYGYDFVRRGVSDRIGEYTHNNQNINDYVNDYVMPACMNSIKESLSSIYWGMSLAELVKEPIGNQIALKKLYVTSPEQWWSSNSIELDEFYDPITFKPVGSQEIPLYDENGIQQLAIYTYRREYTNPYGFATGRQIYPYYFIKTRMLQFFAMYMERYGSPTSIFQTSEDASTIIESWKNLGTDAVMVVGQDTVPNILEPSHDAGAEYLSFIEQLDKYILLCFYIPKLVVSEGQYSTRSQSEVHLDVYIKTETEICHDFVENYLIKQIIKPMIELNFGKQEDYGSIKINDPIEPSVQEWLDIFKSVNEIGALDLFNQEQRDFIERSIGIPLSDIKPPV